MHVGHCDMIGSPPEIARTCSQLFDGGFRLHGNIGVTVSNTVARKIVRRWHLLLGDNDGISVTGQLVTC